MLSLDKDYQQSHEPVYNYIYRSMSEARELLPSYSPLMEVLQVRIPRPQVPLGPAPTVFLWWLTQRDTRAACATGQWVYR